MSKFKVGDRVRCINPGIDNGLATGGIYTVTAVYNDPNMICVNNSAHTLRRDFFYYQTRFELVEEAEPTDEQLAADLREARAKCFELGAKLQKRGWTIKLKESHVPIKYHSDNKDIVITRTEQRTL